MTTVEQHSYDPNMYPLATRLNVRLAELLGVLSLGTDVGLGQPMEHALRQCVIALRLADRFEVDLELRATIYYTALLMNVGGHCDGYERAQWFGDDIALLAARYGIARQPRRARGRRHDPPRRLRPAGDAADEGRREDTSSTVTANSTRPSSERVRVAADLARRLRLPDEVVDGDLRGQRALGRQGRAISAGRAGNPRRDPVRAGRRVRGSRRTGSAGRRRSPKLAQRRSGNHLDPRLCAAMCADADLLPRRSRRQADAGRS